MPKAQKLKPGQIVKVDVAYTGDKTYFILVKSTEKKKGAHNIPYTKYYIDGFTVYKTSEGDTFRVAKLPFFDVDGSVVDLWFSQPGTEIVKGAAYKQLFDPIFEIKEWE